MNKIVVVLMLLWSMGATAAGQVLSLETACPDASTPEACASNLYMSLNIKAGIGDEGLGVDTRIVVKDRNGNIVLVFTENGWKEYVRGTITPYYLVPRAIDPTFKFEPLGTGANVSDYFGYSICWGYGRRGTPNGTSLDDLILRGTYQCWELTRFVNAVKRMSVLIRNPEATDGGGVRVINDSLSSSALTIVPMGGQTFSVTVTPPSPPLGFRIKTTVRINGLVAHHHFSPNNAAWYGTESRTGYFSSIQPADDLLEVTSELEVIPPEPTPSDDNNVGGGAGGGGGGPGALPPPPPPG